MWGKMLVKGTKKQDWRRQDYKKKEETKVIEMTAH